MKARRAGRTVALSVCVGLAAPAAAEQTGTISGVIVSEDGAGLPGATLTLESPALQGQREAVSGEGGRFQFVLVPPGEYAITATLTGMSTVRTTGIPVTVGQSIRPRLTMKLAPIQETVVVEATSVSELDTTAVVKTLDGGFLESLPIRRDLDSIARLAPGVAAGSYGTKVNGAQAYENNFLMNGTIINKDNLRGEPYNLFIEDDIESVQVLSANISAEYGYFTGGVVNLLTKSGGNAFHGTFRTELSQQNWRALNPHEKANDVELNDELDTVYTVTVNGPILKDQLWFAVAGRTTARDEVRTFRQGTPLRADVAARLGVDPGVPKPAGTWVKTQEEQRLQFKLTATPFSNHSVVVGYLDDQLDRNNHDNRIALDFGALSPNASDSTGLLTANYRGILSPTLALDAQYARRASDYVEGGLDSSLVGGTSVIPRDQGVQFLHAPFGNGTVPFERDSDNASVKLSWAWNAGSLGFHDLAVGVQQLHESSKVNQVESASGFQVWHRWTRFDENGDYRSIFQGAGSPQGEKAWIVFYPLQNPSRGSDFTTRSLYLNDRWTLDDHWSFNLGLRYDRNDAKAEDRTELSRTDKLSPRLSVNWDVLGDGRHQLSAGFNKYAARINNSAQAGSLAGTTGVFAAYYEGPQTESLEELWAWVDARYPGGLAGIRDVERWRSNPDVWLSSYSSDTSFEHRAVVVDPAGLDSQGVDELVFSYKHRLGGRGFAKADFIHRSFGDFLVGIIDQTTGQTADGVDRTVLTNENELHERTYKGLQLSAQYTFGGGLLLGGNYVRSSTRANYEGQNGVVGAIAESSLTAYPEFRHPRLAPVGRIDDRAHDLRFWAVYDLRTGIGRFNLGLLHTWFTGRPYSVVDGVNVSGRETAFGLPDPSTLGYADTPDFTTYYFSDPAAFEWGATHSTDLAVNYVLRVGRFDFFVQADLTNVFNRDAQTGGNTDVDVSPDATWNLLTETPREGVHYTRGEQFGRPQSGRDYQEPRAFRFDLGLRF